MSPRSARARTLPIELVTSAVEFATAQGWDVDTIMDESGIPASLLTQGRARITEPQATQIIRTLWRLTDDELLGFGTHPLPRGSFKLLCYGLLGAADLNEALTLAQSFASAIPAMPKLQLEVHDDLATLSWDNLEVPHDPAHLWTFAGVALVHRLISWALAKPVALGRVELPFTKPPNTELADLVFGTDQTYGTDRPALVFQASYLKWPLMRSADELEVFIAQSPAGLLARPRSEAPTSTRVRRLVRQGLDRGDRVGATEVADQLAISTQTLRRLLGDEGTNLRAIRDTELRDAAISALVQTQEPISAIAIQLGFSEPSAFSRAFRRWTGTPPSGYRSEPLAPSGML